MIPRKLNKIIFVDSDETANSHHEKIARQAGVAEELHFFTSAINALSFLSEIKTQEKFPRLIFTDIKLPDMDGYHFAQELKKHPCFYPTHTALVYLIHTLSNSDVAAFSKNRGQHVYFKNLDEKELTGIVREIVPPKE